MLLINFFFTTFITKSIFTSGFAYLGNNILLEMWCSLLGYVD